MTVAALMFGCSSNGDAPGADASTDAGVDATDGAVQSIDGSDGSARDAAPPSDAAGDAAQSSDGAASCAAPATGLPTGSGTLQGTIQGRTQTVTETAGRIYRPGNAGAWQLWVELDDYTNACGYSEASLDKASSHGVILQILSTSTAATAPFTAGTYTSQGLTQTDAGSYEYRISVTSNTPGPVCKGSSAQMSATGTLTLTTLTASRLTGSYDLTVAGGDHITGQFDTPNCTPVDVLKMTCCAQ